MGRKESSVEGMVEFWANKRVLVTGCAGFLGGHLTDALIKKGATVTGLVRDIPQHGINELDHKKFNVIFGDLCDYDLLCRILVDYQIEIVFHLGAQAIVTIANEYPLETFKSNIQGTWNILEACRIYGKIESIVVASSDKAYGEPLYEPYNEEHPLNGSHPYDVSKSCADLIAKTYVNTYHLPISITRCGNLYGPRDTNYNRLIPGTIKSILKDDTVEIRSNGKYKRDYLYINDALDGYLKISENLSKNPSNAGAYNLSHGKPYTILEVVDCIKFALDKENHPVRILDTANAEINNQWLDSSKIRNKLNWESKTTLDKGIAQSIEWYISNVDK